MSAEPRTVTCKTCNETYRCDFFLDEHDAKDCIRVAIKRLEDLAARVEKMEKASE